MILVDSGVLIAAANASDRHHVACEELVRKHRGAMLISPLVVAEVCYLLGKLAGRNAKAAFLDGFTAGVFVLGTITLADVSRMAQLMRGYPELNLDAADASIVALAERLRLDTVATIDRRDFRVIRPDHVRAFALLPEFEA